MQIISRYQRTALNFYFWLLALINFWQNLGYASGATVSPVWLVISKKEPISVLRVTNDGCSDLTLQLQLKSWMRSNEKDLLQNSDDLLISPKLIRIPPKVSQLVRVRTKKILDGRSEHAYRIYLREIPQQDEQTNQVSLKFRLDLSLPVFVEPLKPVKDLQWSYSWLDAGHLQVRAKNIGNQSIFSNRWTLKVDQNNCGDQIPFRHLFPGEMNVWVVPLERAKYASKKIDIALENKISG